MKVVRSQWSKVSKSACCFALCAIFFAVWVPVYAQQQAKLPKIGWLAVRPASAELSPSSRSSENLANSATSTART